MSQHLPRAATLEEVWRRYDAVEARLTAAVSERMLDLAGVGPGARVLDLATGRGEPALRAARRVGPSGHVLGVDVADAMLAMAREQALREGIAHLTLRALDAEALDDLPAASFDAATARWGLMYMRSPVRALTGVRRALAPGAPLVAALWAELDRVAWAAVPRRALGRLRAVPDVDPEAPGAFRYADPARIARDFAAAGLVVERVEEMTTDVIEAATGEGIAAWARDLGFAALVGGLSGEETAAWEADVAREVERGRAGDVVRLGGVTRLVVARAPG